jgi:hypothetical protein
MYVIFKFQTNFCKNYTSLEVEPGGVAPGYPVLFT